jgi:hypothetical protein
VRGLRNDKRLFLKTLSLLLSAADASVSVAFFVHYNMMQHCGQNMFNPGTPVRIATLLLFAALLASCDNIRFWESDRTVETDDHSLNAAQLLDVRKRAATIQTSLDRFPRRDFSLMVNDTMISATLYGDAGDPVMVDERWFDRSGTTGRYRYYFDDGLLFHFYGKSSVSLDLPGQSEQSAEILLRLYFNSKGNMFEFEKQVNETGIDLDANELPAIMRRSEALRLLAYTDSIGGFDTSAVLAVLHGGNVRASEARMELTDDTAEDAGITGDAPSMQDEAAPELTVDSETRPQAPDRPRATAPRASSQADAASGTETRQQQRREQAPSPTAVTTTQQPKRVPAQPAQPTTVTRSERTQENPRLIRKPVRQPVSEEDDSIIPPHTHRMIPGPLNSSRVRFQKGSTGITLSARLEKGRHNEYVLRARRGQTMSITLDSEQTEVAFRVFLDDNDISGERRSWSGALPRYGDYHVVVYIRQTSALTAAGYTITIGIR